MKSWKSLSLAACLWAVGASSTLGADLVTHLFPHKDGEADNNVGGNFNPVMAVGANGGASVAWITYQIGGADLGLAAGSSLTLYLDSLHASGTLRIFALTSAVTGPEMDVEIGDLTFDEGSPVAGIALSGTDQEKIIRLDLGGLLSEGPFYGLVLAADSGLRADFGSKDGDLQPLIELRYAIASPEQVQAALDSAASASAAASAAAASASSAAASAAAAASDATTTSDAAASAAGSASSAASSATSASSSATSASSSATSASNSASSASTSASNASTSASNASASASSASTSAQAASDFFTGGGLYLASGVPSGFSATGLRWNFEKGWGTKTAMGTARNYAGYAESNNKIYVHGGTNGSSLTGMEVYNPATDTWTGLAGTSANLFFHSLSSYAGKLYAIGGLRTSGTVVSSDIFRYDTSSNTWATMTAMPTARNGHGAAAISGKIYVISGATNTNHLSVTTSHEVYDIATDSWSSAAAISTGRCDFATVVLDGKIHAIGGTTTSGAGLSSHEVYNPSNNTWSAAAPLPWPLWHIGAVAVGGKIYVLGGVKVSGSAETTVLQYDPDGNSWLVLTQPMLGRRYGFKPMLANGKVYTAAGHNTSNALSSVEEWNPPTVLNLVQKN